MKRFIRKSLLRPRDRGELGALYLACFLLVTFLQFLERRAAGSETLVRYLRFIIDNQIAFVLTVLIIHHDHHFACADGFNGVLNTVKLLSHGAR